jgi:hypothetical protein
MTERLNHVQMAPTRHPFNVAKRVNAALAAQQQTPEASAIR